MEVVALKYMSVIKNTHIHVHTCILTKVIPKLHTSDLVV